MCYQVFQGFDACSERLGCLVVNFGYCGGTVVGFEPQAVLPVGCQQGFVVEVRSEGQFYALGKQLYCLLGFASESVQNPCLPGLDLFLYRYKTVDCFDAMDYEGFACLFGYVDVMAEHGFLFFC